MNNDLRWMTGKEAAREIDADEQVWQCIDGKVVGTFRYCDAYYFFDDDKPCVCRALKPLPPSSAEAK
jgi:hypothetical protein